MTLSARFPFLLFCLINSSVAGQDTKLSLPLRGEVGKDYFIDYMVDNDPSEAILDANCGSKSYNGHNGTDFALLDFQAMDSGVYVYAAAAGMVIATSDGAFDRSTSLKPGMGYLGGLGNYVCIGIERGLRVYYAHFRKNSILVKVGDTVAKGQPIGLVGSSGYSSGPHLHFEVRGGFSFYPVDPFKGYCNRWTSVVWDSVPVYDTASYVIGDGLVAFIPSREALLERPTSVHTFSILIDEACGFWVNLHGARREDDIRVEWYGPNGGPVKVSNYTWAEDSWNTYFWSYLPMPIERGEWYLKWFINGKLRGIRTFYVER